MPVLVEHTPISVQSAKEKNSLCCARKVHAVFTPATPRGLILPWLLCLLVSPIQILSPSPCQHVMYTLMLE